MNRCTPVFSILEFNDGSIRWQLTYSSIFFNFVVVFVLSSTWKMIMSYYVVSKMSNVHEPKLGNITDVQYLLWTRSNPHNDESHRLILGNDTSLMTSHFNGSHKTYFMFHGYNDQVKTGWIVNFKTAILNMEEANVISVDWRKLVPFPWYIFARINSQKVGNYTGLLIDWLHEKTGLATSNIHITGHSLGAHAAGFTGKHTTVGTIGRITGLDPAGPMFYAATPDQRIDKSDAAFVDVIHTNGGSFILAKNGLYKAVGTVDFYPNGGRHQPGCSTGFNSFDQCSHLRVTNLWTESLQLRDTNNTFQSWPCDSWQSYQNRSCSQCGQGCLQMGFFVDKSLRGLYYLRTASSSPYGLGPNQ